TLAVRDTHAGERAAGDIAATSGSHDVGVRRLDLSDRASVAAFAAGWDGPLHMLVNNAGIMALPELELTPDGWELQFATNHLGHFALALGLRDALAAAGDARIVSVSSRAHLMSPVIFEDLHFADRRYEPLLAYAQSKTANVLFAVEAARRWAADGITANALHPGAIATTGLQRHLDPNLSARLVAAEAEKGTLKTPQQGAATSVLLAASQLVGGVGGRYFEDCHEAEAVDPSAGDPLDHGVAVYALDPDAARRLWDVSLNLVS
ncbi:MAG TPA: SDR family NAD(P)-dependent oxidoreductase, partial [Baekduia sp.]|nr:SDR family NAD(P)-dependent oxidoreductase [Baekduia sp.]